MCQSQFEKMLSPPDYFNVINKSEIHSNVLCKELLMKYDFTP